MNKSNAIIFILLAAGGLSACASHASGSADSATPSSPADNTPDSPTSLGAEEEKWLEELRKNRSDVVAQQKQERAETEGLLPLPEGAEWSTFEQFDELDSQIARLEGGQSLAKDQTHPMSLWYEDGFFASLMALDWQCAWLSEAVSQYDAGNVAIAEEAVEQLYSFAENPLAAAFPDYGSYLSIYVEPIGPKDTSAATPTLRHCATESLVPAYRETLVTID